MLSADEIGRSQRRLAEILRAHDLDWIVRRVDDALEEGRQPEHGQFENLELRRLVLLIEATQRALAMSSALEQAVPNLLLQETGGRRVHIEQDPEDAADVPRRPPIVLERDTDALRAQETARTRTHQRLERLLGEAVESS